MNICLTSKLLNRHELAQKLDEMFNVKYLQINYTNM